MRKNTLKKAFALLVILAMLLPCIPVLASAEATVTTRAYEDKDMAWYGDGSATEFTISNAEELAYFMSLTATFKDKTIKLDADIVWNDGEASETGFTPSQEQGNTIYNWKFAATTFEGTFDGQGHTISGLYMVNSLSNYGFLGAIKNATIKNTVFTNAFFSVTGAKKNLGLVAGLAYGSNTFSNIHVDAYQMHTVTTTTANIGGICGLLSSASSTHTFENCTVRGKVSNVAASGTPGVIGGMLGASKKTITVNMTDCINYASVVGRAEVAGLVARFAGAGTLTRCTSFGQVSHTANGTHSASLIYARNNDDGTAGTVPATWQECKTITFSDCHYVSTAGSYPAVVHGAEPGFRIVTLYGSPTAFAQGSFYDTDKTSYNNATALKSYFKALSVPAKGTDVVAIKGLQTAKADNTFKARFVASVKLGEIEASSIQQIGFQVALLNPYALGTEGAVKVQNCKSVYTSITSNYGLDNVTAEDLGADYLATLVVTDIPTNDSQTLLIRPYYVTTSGVTYYGGYVACSFVNGEYAGDAAVSTADSDTIIPNPVKEASQALASSYNTDTYDLAPLLPEGASDISVKASKGQTVNGTTVSLNVGENYFKVTYTENGTEKSKTIAIARRAGHRVVFNSNGGSYIAPQSVADGGKLTNATPTRVGGYEFLGWFLQDGTPFDFSNATVTNDMMLVAHWQAPSTPAPTDTDDALTYSTSSAAINVVWKDYANAFSVRPASVDCTLSDGTNSYKVVVTENNAYFANGKPANAEISTGAGNWTVKITGLDGTKSYTFTADDLSTNAYEKQQSGTAVTYTLNDYNPMLDDSAWLMTQNGRLYDYAGNVVVLKGVVTHNVGWAEFKSNVSIASLMRLQKEGVNCIRVTMFVETEDNNHGYHMANDSLQTEARRAELRTMLMVAIDNASSLGMYCIVDWGILASIEMTDEVNATAKELFVTLATDYKDNPYVIYEICNEPKNNTWSSIVKGYAEDVIEAIREAGSNAIVIVGPDNSATNISKSGASNDPIDAPISTALAYNVAYSFHTYTYSREYSHGNFCYGWILRDALEAGLTIISTEFSPADAAMSDTTTNVDLKEADKFLNLFLENDMSYVFFRYISKDISCGQYMFREKCTEFLNSGLWTTDMLSESGKWFYDSAMNSDGFIKNADFDYDPTTRGY